MRKRQVVFLLIIILAAIFAGWFIPSNKTLKQDVAIVAPTQSPRPSDKPSESLSPTPEQSSETPSASPTPEQSSETPSASPTPKQTRKVSTAKPSKTKVPNTPTATPSSKVKPSPSPTSTSRYPIMRGDVVPINETNRRYTAGIDIPVGLYHSTGKECGYRVNTAENEIFYVTVFEKGSTVVDLKKGDQLSNSDCSITFGPPTFQDVLLVGTHLVGVDIEPGIYHAENYLSCTFALASRAQLTRGNQTQKMGFGNLNGVRDMLIPADAEAVIFYDECGVLTKVG